jgi:hypothetical protein
MVMSRQDKKERQRLKRKRKQLALRKERNTSIFRKLGQGGSTECYINGDWREQGLASLQVFREGAGGIRVFAAFLIDLWCSGLKDAFGRAPALREEFEDQLDAADDRGLRMTPIDAGLARRLVAGAMRLSRENGFRLPHRAERWASVVGVTGYADADLSDFEKPDGSYRYVGTLEDLRRRLIGSVEDFVARPDVKVVLGLMPSDPWADDFELEDATEELGEGDDQQDDDDDDAGGRIPAEFLQGIDEIRRRACESVRRWLNETGRTPHPRLEDGVDLALMAAIVESSAAEDPGARQVMPAVENVIAGHDDPKGLVEAIAQVREFFERYETPTRMLEAMGFGDGPAGADEGVLAPHGPA